MKTFVFYSFIVFTLLSIASCDPARVLIIKTYKKPNVSVTLYAKSDLYNGIDSANKTIKITSTSKDTLLFFGLGGWGIDSLMPNFSQRIDSIIIINTKDTLLLNTQENINEYLLKNRHGFAKRKLIIEAK